MDLFLSRGNGKPLAAQLYEQVRLSITAGRLRPGDQLPPSRQLASQLGISRHTVTTAYDRLVAEGYVEGHAGGGSVVAGALEAARLPARRVTPLRLASRLDDWAPCFQPKPSPCRFDIRPGIPDPALFPAAAWGRRLAVASADPDLGYGYPAGEPALRRAIAAWVARSRSVVASEENVVITSGSQQAIDLVARVLVEPGDCVAVEDPGYAPAARLFRALGATVTGVPVDDQGLMVDLLPPSARIVYVTPSHQFPLGMTMTMPRRQALLRWAELRNAAIIEDDYDTEFRYVDRPFEPIQRLDEHGRVVYVGSFSKSFTPAIRLGFAVLPEPLTGPIAALRQCTDWNSPPATQAALAGFIEDGSLEKHVRRCRPVYGERRRMLIDALSGPLARHLTAPSSSAGGAGLHIPALLRDGLGEDEVLRALHSRAIAACGMRDCFHARPYQQGLLLGFSAVSTTDLPVALRALAAVLESCAP
jgi:GntR family transcriptional regulator/MocR family aminotransferase